MAIIWADGFDHYGGNLSMALQGGYVQFSIAPGNSVVNARTGNGYLICSVNFGRGARRALNSSVSALGVGVGYLITGPNIATGIKQNAIRFGSSLNLKEISVNVNANAGLTIWQGTGAVASSDNNLIAFGTWYHIETKVVCNSGVGTNDGTVEVRLNGVQRVIATGLNLPNALNSVTLGSPNDANANDTVWFDDFVIWDTSVADPANPCNDFLGDRRCVTSYPSADAATMQWVPSTGVVGWDRINDAPPVDTSFVEGINAGDIAEFSKTPIGIATNDIAAAVVVGRIAKTDAGVSLVRLGIHSGIVVSNGPQLSPSVTAAYFQQFYHLDPNTGGKWTQPNLDAANIRITRDS
jgi:hypothetical protein